ncbi:D-alanine--D-alanine ligase [Mesohalobacter halotolerans]|uniref:D-alanine--D-alanine ligase n=1 Tax=Mesohalobacter halotolerans TaxID=1883405 RepID=A0A4V6ALG9_9FLAO|nr:D-alanine--D-alanine ligase [Mesohalobacter halotolerans]MBS3738734.1 D-alanine--D-alanine ligase [Psychroflexus sp.]TKS56775.1 D-alanine--D-alanine ligase [Mesohalobacter halotolerans]
MKKTVAIAMGGYTSECDVSLQSGKNVYDQLKDVYEVYQAHILKEDWYVWFDDQKYPINKSDFSVLIKGKKVTFDLVFNTIHGTPGEDGLIQGYLKNLNIKQTAADYYHAALTYNKRDCISVLKAYGIPTANNYFYNQGDNIDPDAIVDAVGLPCFVKANRAGSSFGITKVKAKNEIPQAIAHALKEDDEVIIESFLEGREFSVGVINYQGEVRALPITEIISENEFFDFEAKYYGKSKEITPAELTSEETQSIQELAVKIFKTLKMKGLTRSEFIFHNGKPHFLEINACPGLTKASILPQQAKAAGISLKDLFSNTIEMA